MARDCRAPEGGGNLILARSRGLQAEKRRERNPTWRVSLAILFRSSAGQPLTTWIPMRTRRAFFLSAAVAFLALFAPPPALHAATGLTGVVAISAGATHSVVCGASGRWPGGAPTALGRRMWLAGRTSPDVPPLRSCRACFDAHL